MRFSKLRILLATVCVMAVATAAIAAGTSWTDLTEDQQKKYMTLHDDLIKKTAPIRDKMWAKNMELNALMSNENIDPKAVTSIVKDVNELRAKMRAEREAFDAQVKKEVGIDPIANPHRGRRGQGGCYYGGDNMHGGGHGGYHGGGHYGMGRGKGRGNCPNMPAPQAPAQ